MSDAGSLNLFLIVVFVLFSGFFSSSEAAYLSLERVRVAHLVNSNVPGARRIAGMLAQPERLLATILLGNNLVNVAFTAIVTVVAIDLLGENTGLVVATVAGTLVLLVFGEIMPKTFAVHNSERLAFVYARPLKAVELVLWPLVMVLQWMTRRTRTVLGGRDTAEGVHNRGRTANPVRHRRGGGHFRARRGGHAGERAQLRR